MDNLQVQVNDFVAYADASSHLIHFIWKINW